MTLFEAFLLGILQGLTEFLPVSSSGHLELGNHILHTPAEGNLAFALTVHAATVLSTITVFQKEISALLRKGLTFKERQETIYLGKLLFSALPIAVVGLLFKEKVESLYSGNLLLVGCFLLVTAVLLAFAHFRKECRGKGISWMNSFVIGIAQAFAVMPGLSRSGATIATGILMGNERKEVARFSFLMVLLPVLGANFLEIAGGNLKNDAGADLLPLFVGFITAYVSGLLACKWMIKIVSRGKLIYFAIYCLIIALIAIFAA